MVGRRAHNTPVQDPAEELPRDARLRGRSAAERIVGGDLRRRRVLFFRTGREVASGVARLRAFIVDEAAVLELRYVWRPPGEGRGQVSRVTA
jgi:hypothetical protein